MRDGNPNPNLKSESDHFFFDPERIRICNLDYRFGLLIFKTFVALKQNLILTVSFMLILS